MSAVVTLRSELVDDVDTAEGLAAQWDELAVSAERPYSSPSWMLAWWRHAAPPGALLRIAVVRQGGELLGVGPFFAEPRRWGVTRYRLLGAGSAAPIEPLARVGNEYTVAALLAGSLASATPPPDVVSFDGAASAPGWPRLIRRAWPRQRPRLVVGLTMPWPTLRMEGRTVEEWLVGKSRHARQSLRRHRRRLEDAGGTFRIAETDAQAVRALRRLAELHYARWETRGGSRALNPRLERMLVDVAHDQVESGRFRMGSIEIDDQLIACELFLAAGGSVAHWLGGFDEAWAKHGPSKQVVLGLVEDAWRRGDRTLELGPGGQDHKDLFSDEAGTLEWIDLVPRGPRSALARLRMAPKRVRQAGLEARHRLARRLSPEAKKRARALLRRIRAR
jgi:CelD/BcsL family acetyltransferase involved in cellulose biosynthesis